jgi:hypothetical protein
MAKEDLIPQSMRTKDEQKKIARQGGIASGKSRLRKKHGRELMKELLRMRELDPDKVQKLALLWGLDPKDLTKEMEMNIAQIDKAIDKADTFAFKTVHQVAGTLDEDGNTGTTVNIIVSKEAAEAANKWCK